jgi:hypothetical protein
MKNNSFVLYNLKLVKRNLETTNSVYRNFIYIQIMYILKLKNTFN